MLQSCLSRVTVIRTLRLNAQGSLRVTLLELA